MPPQSLTEHLQSVHPAHEAITHPFLAAAGYGTLPRACLALWLAQDRIYAAHAYPRFVGRLLSDIPFSSRDPLGSDAELANQRVLAVLGDALANILREVAFFGETAERYGLDLDIGEGGERERKGTRDYTAEMARVAVEGTLEDGIVFLWAMEKIYLDAWKHVGQLRTARLSAVTTASLDSHPDAGHGDDATDAAIASFVENWTSAPFARFVDDLAVLVDGFDIARGSAAWRRAEGVWARVVELEIAFWPDDGEV